MSTELEKSFESQITRYRLPLPKREDRFAVILGRQYRWDFSWREYMVAVELHGLVNSGIGGHQTIPGMTRDMDKQNAGILLGWSCLVFAQSHVKSEDAIAMTQRALASRGWRQS